MIKQYWREFLILALGACCAILWVREPEVKIVTETKTVEVVVEKKVVEFKDRVVYKDRVRTRTITKERPGEKVTIVEKVESSEQSRDVEAKESSNSERSRTEQSRQTVEVRPAKPRYHVGGSYSLSGRTFDLGVFARVGSSPAFFGLELEMDAKAPHKSWPQPKIGVTLEL